MGRYEVPLTRRFWKTVGGTLVHDFPVIKRSSKHGARSIEALIVPDGPPVELFGKTVDVTGKDVIVVQTKAHRLSTLQLGEAVVARELARRNLDPASVRAVAVCRRDDDVLAPIATDQDIEVVVMGS